MAREILIDENTVSYRFRQALANRWIVEPAKYDGYPEKRITGLYLSTQQRLTKGASRAHFAKNSTQSAGVPDFLVRLNHWPELVWIAIELKRYRVGASGKVLEEKASDEQKLLQRLGAILITNEIERALQAIDDADARLTGGQGKNP